LLWSLAFRDRRGDDMSPGEYVHNEELQ
jgi:hypothetical protein